MLLSIPQLARILPLSSQENNARQYACATSLHPYAHPPQMLPFMILGHRKIESSLAHNIFKTQRHASQKLWLSTSCLSMLSKILFHQELIQAWSMMVHGIRFRPWSHFWFRASSRRQTARFSPSVLATYRNFRVPAKQRPSPWASCTPVYKSQCFYNGTCPPCIFSSQACIVMSNRGEL